LNVPVHCPSCLGEISQIGAHLICQNPNCPAQISATLLHFIRCLDIEGFSEKSVDLIVESGILDKKDLFQLSLDDLQGIGFGPTQSTNFYDQLHSLKISKARFLKSLGIDKAGERVFEKVLEVIPFDSLIDGEVTLDQLNSVVGTKTAEAIFNGLNNKKTFISAVLPNIEIEEPAVPSNATLSGTLFCITGTLTRKRAEVEKIILDNGGKIGSVSKHLDYLILGMDPGSKLDKAKKLGVKIISETDFEKKFGIQIS
jgi:DNA ligase (NAD+)